MRRADRLLDIIHFLRRHNRAVTAQRISEEFEICTRTVYRDIQDLMSSGIPIKGEAGVGYVIDKDYYLPPIAFDADELAAISLGINMVSQWTDSQFAEKANSAFNKVLAASRIGRQLDSPQFNTHTAPLISQTIKTEHFSSVRDCIHTRRKIVIEYVDSQNSTTSRTIRPLALIFFNSNWLIAAWCEKRATFRHFRLDRIQKIHCQEAIFPNDADKNLEAYMIFESDCEVH